MKKAFSVLLFALTASAAFAQDEGYVFEDALLEVDVAVNAFTAVIQDRVFYVEGYIYPAGTLNESNGINDDGSAEFPDLVLGLWTCTGWFINDRGEGSLLGARTSQTFEFGEAGDDMLVSFGFEPAAPGIEVTRAVTGGTGDFFDEDGEQIQNVVGVNLSGSVNLAISIVETEVIIFKHK
jgi:hypothetical protein